MIPQGLDGIDPCTIAVRWGISLDLARRLRTIADNLPFGLMIISGARSCEEQDALRESGRPAAACSRSTHVATCPATGADVWPALGVDDGVKVMIGREAIISGLRWGGGSALDFLSIPTDWNHLDLGPVGI